MHSDAWRGISLRDRDGILSLLDLGSSLLLTLFRDGADVRRLIRCFGELDA